MKKNFSVEIPRNIDEFLQLCKDILLKHTTDGLTSVLTILNMLSFQSIYTIAKNLNIEANAMDRDKEEAFQQRDLALGIDNLQFSYTPNTVLFYVTSIRDILFGVHKGTEQSMGRWGFVVNRSKGGIKVPIPLNAKKLIDLGNLIHAKHTADGVGSVLSSLDMAAFATLLATAETQDTLANKLLKDRVDIVNARNIAIGYDKGQSTITPNTLLNLVTSVRDVLLGKHKGAEQHLGNWGFNVIMHSAPIDPPPVVATIVKGMVKDATTLAPIGNANVTFITTAGATTVLTDPLGNYEAVFAITADETATINIVAAGYVPYLDNITIVLSQTLVLDIDLATV